jgi:hypothetical protein
MIRKIAVGCCVCVVSIGASAQGSFNFDRLSGLDADPIITIDISSIAISLARAAIAPVDPATADVLSGLRGIALRVYHAEDNVRQVNNFIKDADEELLEDGWERVLFVDGDGMSVRLHMQMTDTEVSGLTLLLFDGAEAVFLNIDGSVSAADLGRVMAALNQGGVLEGFSIPGATAAPASAANE